MLAPRARAEKRERPLAFPARKFGRDKIHQQNRHRNVSRMLPRIAKLLLHGAINETGDVAL